MQQRIDRLLVEKGFFASRQKAKYAVEEEIVYINGQKVTKVSKMIDEDSVIEIKGEVLPFVSRGGLKLDKAVRVFKINLKGKVCADIGASTGGFTDCMLQKNANKVYAIDVGHDQLAESLRQNDKVVNLEGINIKDLDAKKIGEVDFASTDVSFIPVEQVLSKMYELLKIKGRAVILIKPQFEAGRSYLNKNGVVKDKKVHQKVILNVIEAVDNVGFKVLGLDFSPIKGPAGNIEYLLYMQKDENKILDTYVWKDKIKQVVEDAHKNLK